MNNVLLFRDDGVLLDREAVRSALAGIEGTYNLREGNLAGSVLDCEFDFAGDSTIIRLSADLRRVSFSGGGDASLEAARQLQRCLGLPLRLVDTAYSFDLLLANTASLAELRERITAES